MSAHAHLATLFVLLLLSVLGPALAVRVRLPAAVLLILAGIACGPAGLAWVDDTPQVALLSELGFLVLMFVAGMEIDFESLRSAGPRQLALPALCVMGFAGVAATFGIWMNLSVLELLIVSASSVGMPLAVLQESGQLQTPLGRHVMLTASIGEFVSILAITGYELFAEQATVAHRSFNVLKVVLLFGVSALLIRWARAAVWWRPEPFRRLTQHHDVAELGLRTGLLVMFGFVVVAASLGVEAILGAFIAGALVAFVLREKHALESKVAALGHGLFIPIFFIVVGLRFDPRLLTFTAVRDAIVFVLVVAAVKVIPSLIFAPPALGLRARLGAASLLAAPLTLVVAISSSPSFSRSAFRSSSGSSPAPPDRPERLRASPHRAQQPRGEPFVRAARSSSRRPSPGLWRNRSRSARSSWVRTARDFALDSRSSCPSVSRAS